jgi:hypothetical protein
MRRNFARKAAALRTVIMITVAAASLLAGGTVAAQPTDRDLERGKDIFKNKATCLFCHAWHGGGESSQYGGIALSLRDTKLDRGQIIEVVKCGRPGTGMPYHDAFAYTDKRCYGMTKAELKDGMPPEPRSPLPAREIELVVDYVLATFKGKPAPGLAECVAFWGEGTKLCDEYRK